MTKKEIKKRAEEYAKERWGDHPGFKKERAIAKQAYLQAAEDLLKSEKKSEGL